MVSFVDLILPLRCVVCGGLDEVLCPSCLKKLSLLRSPLCARCGAPTAWPVPRCLECTGRRLPFASARGAVIYEGPARTIVAAWKERGQRRLTATLAELVAQGVPRPRAAAIAFVPGEQARTLWRGGNPAEALAEELGCRWELPVADLLARTGSAPRQRGLSRAGRRSNVRDRFRACVRSPGRVVLVDDVYTTGATVSAAATELRRAGARAVEVVTFARAVRR